MRLWIFRLRQIERAVRNAMQRRCAGLGRRPPPRRRLAPGAARVTTARSKSRRGIGPREKVFGPGRFVLLDRNAKVRVMMGARALMRHQEKGKAYGKISAKALAVLTALLWRFHNVLGAHAPARGHAPGGRTVPMLFFGRLKRRCNGGNTLLYLIPLYLAVLAGYWGLQNARADDAGSYIADSWTRRLIAKNLFGAGDSPLSGH
jgi:hypothetical protein